MVKIEFIGEAGDVLADMLRLLGVGPIVPLAAVVAPAPVVEREPELPGLTPADLAEVIAAKEAAPVEAPARKRRTKAEMEAARAAEAAAEVARASEAAADSAGDDAARAAISSVGADTAPPAGEPLTFEDVKDILKEVCEADGLGVAAATKLLADFGVARLSLLAEARWPDFHAAANNLVTFGATR